MSSRDSVGSLLADVAYLIEDGLRILHLSQQSHWGPDEYEQLRTLERILDEARKDFQELTPLVNGARNYELDRNHESLEDLRAMRYRFGTHVENLRDWSKAGGPIDPTWTRHLQFLQKDLHRTQCRIAGRIHTSGQETSRRCLGAHLVLRTQRGRPKRVEQQARTGDTADAAASAASMIVEDTDFSRQQLSEMVACNRIGSFQRFAEEDIAFICDFCDGHIVWEDLDLMPNTRNIAEASSSNTTTTSNTKNGTITTTEVEEQARKPPPLPLPWQTTGRSRTTSEEKQIVFATVAVANHCAPRLGEWQASLICPYCEAEAQQPQDADDDEDPWKPDAEFEDLEALQEHLEWQHGMSQSGGKGGGGVCLVM